jgi:(S)-mandelate dehydrogenase
LEVFIDGGVRRGSDALKAVALGARGVLLGRAPLYGVAARGGTGASEVLALMMEEMRIAMRLLGCQKISDLGPAFVGREAIGL